MPLGSLCWTFARRRLQAPDPSKNMTADDEAYRRGVLARSRNFLLAEALRDEGWVLWLDADIVQVRPPCSSIVIGQCSSSPVPSRPYQALRLPAGAGKQYGPCVDIISVAVDPIVMHDGQLLCRKSNLPQVKSVWLSLCSKTLGPAQYHIFYLSKGGSAGHQQG
jgi:Anp1